MLNFILYTLAALGLFWTLSFAAMAAIVLADQRRAKRVRRQPTGSALTVVSSGFRATRPADDAGGAPGRPVSHR